MSDTRAGFVRQRRFLLATSLTIFGYQYLGFSAKQVSVLGNTAEVAHPEHLSVVLFVIHAWAVYRYWAHFQELTPWRAFRDDRLTRWRQLLTPSNYAFRQREGDEFMRFQEKHEVEIARLKEKNQITATAHAEGAHLAEVVGSSASTMREQWNVPFFSDDRKGQVGYVVVGVPIGKWRARRASILAWMIVLLNKTFFSEYIVPLVLGVTAAATSLTIALSSAA